MTHLDKQNNDMSIVWKVLAILSFIMLSALTWAAKPLADTYEKIQKKQKAIAVITICRRIVAFEEPYGKIMNSNFVSGCLWETRNVLKSLQPKKSEYVDKVFQEQSSLEWDSMRDHCANGANAYMAEGRIKEVMVAGLYHEELKCPDWESYARTLGVTEEDIANAKY